MGVIKKKPYEISIWEDRLVTENDISYYKEVKLAVIGSDTMESPNRAFDPILVENVNGEKTLTFSLAYKYYDEYTGELVTNVFYKYLINERKVKLFYNDEWFEFVIKECNESSTENIFTYTAKELFSLELAKLGYNVTLDTSLNNNQGTVIELAKRVLENTDWEVDEDNSDLLVQFVQEPLYEAVVTVENGINVINLDTKDSEFHIDNGETIYIFYSYINNRTTDHVQFIRAADENDFIIDDDNVIQSTNYRFISPVSYIENQETGKIEIDGIATVEGTYLNNQGYRLVYKIQTTYDPVMNRTVEIYRTNNSDGAREIYHFLDYNYTTSTLVVSYITNGSNFELYDDGRPQGWSNATMVSSSDSRPPVLQPLTTTTFPKLSKTGTLIEISQLPTVSSYLELKFNGALTSDYKNTYFNQGFEHNRSVIDHVSKGEEFVLRTRYFTSTTQDGTLTPGKPISNNQGLRLIVAKYEVVNEECYATPEAKSTSGNNPSVIKAYKIHSEDDILLQFTDNFELSPNIINNGNFNSNYTQYVVDNVIQVPSPSYVYEAAGDTQHLQYIWSDTDKKYIEKTSSFADYYATTATARYSFTNEQMDDPKFQMGIFLYTQDDSLLGKYIYLEDIQLTRCYRDSNNQIVTLGNVPTAKSEEAHKYYLKPDGERTEKEITTYGDLSFLAQELGINANSIVPVFNEESEKILSVQASNSNYFNILQDLCETFECWLDIRVEHEEDGSIKLDKDGNPIKKIAFKEYAGKDNFAGFRNGINLSGITRNIDSNEIVTKLIVDPVQSEYSDSGSIEIQRAPSNPSGQSYILNLSYYLNRGLITDVEACNYDVNTYNEKTKKLNNEIIKKQDELTLALNALTNTSAQRTTYTSLISEAEKQYNEAIEDFQKLTGWDYDTFCNKYQNIDYAAKADENKDKDWLNNDTIFDIVGEIYISSATLNNYAGILTNIDATYDNLYSKCYGAKEYGISVVSIPEDQSISTPYKTQVTVDDYVSNLQFELIDENGASVLCATSPNERIFIQENNDSPYCYIRFLYLPTNYGLKYYEADGSEVVLDENQISIELPIYDNVAGETYDRHFVLIPSPSYLEGHKGLQQELDELIEEKQQVEKDFYKKYSRFLQEGTWSSQDYIDPELYYFDALQVSNTSAQPKVSYTIDVLEVSQIDGLENYDFRVGDKTYVEDPDFFGYLYQAADVRATTINKEKEPSERPLLDDPTVYEEEIPVVVAARSPVREEVIVSEVEWHLDEPDNNTITVQNYKTQFEDLFQRISATVQTVQRNEITYPKTSSILDKSGLINSTLLADSLNGIGGVGFALTTNGSVAATEDGLVIRDLLNPSNVMRLASIGIQVSTDGGENWGTAINAEGISTDVLTAGTINTQKIWLMDGDNPSFRWDKSGLNAYGLNAEGEDAYDLKTYVRFDKYGLYGIKNDEDYVASSIDDVRNKAHFGVTWDGFFIKNSYEGGGQVAITSDNDIQVLIPSAVNTRSAINLQEKIKIGALEWLDRNGQITTNPIDGIGSPTLYGIRIRNNAGEEVMKTGDDGNLTMTGTINAQAGMFSGQVQVGNEYNTHILIDGASDNPTISSSNYSDGAGTGWIINAEGDATFSNVSVRGAIKTAVFEYEEIQAVGGAFLFRPSSTIKTATYEPSEITIIDEDDESVTIETYYHYENGEKVYNDLIVTVEKPLMFRLNNWVKLSNYNEMGVDPAADLTTYGLVHIYKISEFDNQEREAYVLVDEPEGNPEEQEYYEKVNDEYVLSQDTEVIEGKQYYTLETIPPTYGLTLEGGCAILDSVAVENIEGGALIDFGKTANDVDYQNGKYNYGIGINSSDNYVNLPARAISLFETTIHPNNNTKVTYNYRGILGTLPNMSVDEVSAIYPAYMAGKQGIYTDNMYIGDKNQYLAFYKDANGDSQLRLVAKSFEILPDDSDLPIDLGDSIVEQKIQYTLSTSTEENTVEEEWSDTPYEESFGYYLWQRTYVKYAKGRIQYLPNEDGYYMSAGQPGPAGEDAAVLVIDSSEGTVFRDNTGTTDLTVTIFYGSQVITNASQMHSIFGNNAYLEWEYKDNTNNWVVLLINDPRISDNGFTLSVDAEDVYNKANFRCKLII